MGAQWDDNEATLRLTGSLGQHPAMPLVVMADIQGLPTTRLVFAWVKDSAPLILGQTNFFLEFDVHFYRSQLEFEITPKSKG